MASGVQVAAEVCDAWQELRTRKLACIVAKISDDKTSIVIEAKYREEDLDGATLAEKYETFARALVAPEKYQNESRYVFYDFPFTKGGLDQTKCILLVWCPDDAPVKNKMLYTSSKKGLVSKLDGIAKELQATDPSEMEYKYLSDKMTAV
eukprot:TRINITY_DN1273_c0_g1::TRINITY_DN1273_c0_g1_i1::g.26886::m.26886 TRINITY_DN1273_c0_g1::TRINITY_DN1273_c0_g1_i1::g.26886  ORF type:complete len:163 (+),score=64.39,sp/P78929/COFI_SCHPO/41.78/6e-24,Cofilin_ADF/PF00241.15/6.1e-27 TRINITY_DN1273_c0_g1_i1:41-490(+)